MDELPGENNNQEIGIPEIAAGTVAGIATAALVSSMVGKPAATHAIPPKDELWKNFRARIQSAEGNKVTTPIFEEFRRMKPPPGGTDAASAKAWAKEAEQYCNNHPDYVAFCEAEKKIATAEHADKVREALKKAGRPHAVEDIIRAMDEGGAAAKVSGFKKPLLAFKSLSVGGKIGVGVVALASAVGMGYLVNRLRNQEGASHTERLNQERAEPTFRTLSDI